LYQRRENRFMKWQQVLSTFNLLFQSSRKYSWLATAVPHHMKTFTIPFKPIKVNMCIVWRAFCVTVMVENYFQFWNIQIFISVIIILTGTIKYITHDEVEYNGGQNTTGLLVRYSFGVSETTCCFTNTEAINS